MDLFLRVEPRAFFLVAVSTIVLTLLASWLYLFKKPIKDLDQLRISRTLLQAKVEAGSGIHSDIDLLRENIARLSRELQGQSPPLEQSEMIAHIIGTLDRISEGHDVRFSSVKPGRVRKLSLFEEIPFNLQVSGDYFALFDWLRQVEVELGPMVVKSFEVSPREGGKRVGMKLEMVSYRPGGTL